MKDNVVSIDGEDLRVLLMALSDTIEVISENDAETVYNMSVSEMQAMLERLTNKLD